MAKGGSPSEHRLALDDVGAELEALTATLHDVRDYALVDADSAGSRMAPVDVSVVFEEAAEVVRALAEAHELTCSVSLRSGLRVWGNAVRLRQVLLNLGENAVQFTEPGGHLRIEAFLDDDAVVLHVADTGNGIAPEALPHVFDRHFRARPVAGPAGSVLGLAIVKRIVEAHRGQISIDTAVGRGTTATVRLPAAA